MKEIVDILDKVFLSKESDINTNNAWGFGGGIKTVWTLSDEYSVHKGVAYYRHLPKQPFLNLRDKIGRILTEDKKEILKFLKNKYYEKEN